MSIVKSMYLIIGCTFFNLTFCAESPMTRIAKWQDVKQFKQKFIFYKFGNENGYGYVEGKSPMVDGYIIFPLLLKGTRQCYTTLTNEAVTQTETKIRQITEKEKVTLKNDIFKGKQELALVSEKDALEYLEQTFKQESTLED